MLRALAATLDRCARRQFVEPLGDAVQLTAQVVAGGHLADRQPERGQLAGEVLGVRLVRAARLRSSSSDTRSRSSCRFCASRMSGAAYAACVENARLSRMNG